MSFSKKWGGQPLESIHQRDVAKTLGNMLIEQVAPDGGWLKDALSQMGEIAWGKTYNAAKGDSYEKAGQKRLAADALIKGLIDKAPDDAARSALAQGYARLGHMYEIAGHIARENFFLGRDKQLDKIFKANEQLPPGQEKRIPTKDEMTPGGIHEMLFDEKKPFFNKTVSEMVAILSRPVSEYVFTQHPTNTNTLTSMKLQREIAKDVDDLVAGRGSMAKLQQHIAAFAKGDIVQEKNFTAKDETDIVINFLSNAYHDIDRLYEVVERGLTRKFGKGYDDAQRTALDLKLKFGSWGSAGDKDGNNNIKSENTLEAIVLHKKQAAELLAEDLGKMKDLPAGLADWRARLENAAVGYGNVLGRLERVRKEGNDIALSKEEFGQISQQVRDIGANLGKQGDLQAQVEDAFNHPTDNAQKNALLSFNRKLKVFGLNLGKIEYRETAEEYERALATLLRQEKVRDFGFAQDAAAFSASVEHIRQEKKLAGDLGKEVDAGLIAREEKNMQAALASIMEHPDAQKGLAELTANFMRSAKGEYLRSYTDKVSGDDAITYHTLKRMELARDFDDMITHNVLAECKGTHNLLEALALQVAATDNTGKRARLHVVPLFEEADTMASIPRVLEDGLNNKPYYEHLLELKAREGTADITQQIQIAHSDNARRAGAIASRGIIHEGHHAARNAQEAYNFSVEKYNAKHPNDPKSKLNLQFFEGGSLSDSYRNGVRAATAMIRDFDLGAFAKFTYQGGDLLNYFNQPTSMERLTLRGIVQQAELLENGKQNGIDHVQEEKVIAGLSKLQREYDTIVYEAPGNPIGRLLYELGYRDHIGAGNSGTRGGARKDDPKEKELRAIDASAIRTIGFSETLQHEHIHPTFMGAGKIRASIEDSLGKKLSAGEWHKLYRESPSFKDAIDKLAYSIINSDLQKAGRKIYEKTRTDPVLQQPKWREANAALRDFVARALPGQYVDAGKMVYEAMTGNDFIDPVKNPGHKIIQDYQIGEIGGDGHMLDAADRMKHLIKNIDEMKQYESLGYKHSFISGMEVLEHNIGALAAGAKNLLARLFHNARDTLYHGRTFVADDPKYGAALVDEMERASLKSHSKA